ncbi:Bacterial Ig-like domain (Group 1) /fibronectin type III domain protein [Myxococcus hansupus]|uniref:Bacterial Ig-like domain (Group 1) /fibronectin type III domain protein n=1 Tax=Pseudomyxococcus hansupus TaxID=1297742 RepID=A0A0H4WLA5_9BACT|nr:lamin tail domain-containing protein [Myxococcus hansupus]AKQ64156.1 Bacterial Ig-like domain (Group 1) /fibronectin type III domain protein [Myxococcus hansupus]
MSRRLLVLARSFGLSVLCLGVALGCGGSSTPTPPPPVIPLPDASLSTVEVDRAAQVLANGSDPVTITVTVRRRDGSPLEGRTVRVEVSGDGNTVTQPAERTNAQGVATASVVSTRGGSKRVTAAVDAEGGAVVLGSRPVVVFSALSAARLAFVSSSVTARAGAPVGGLEVAFQDAEGHIVTSATGEVTLALAAGPGGAPLGGTLRAQSVEGVARFQEVVLTRAGVGYQLRAESAGVESALSPLFNVTPAAAATVEVSGLLATAPAGVRHDADVTVRDAFGNVATGYRGTLAVLSSDAAASLPAPHTFTEGDAGRFRFTDIVLYRAGLQRVDIQDTTQTGLTGRQDVRIAAGPTAALAFVQVPSRASVRAALSLVQVSLQDAYGNRTPVGSPNVTLSLAGGAPLRGVTEMAPAEGVASFTSLHVDSEGRVRLQASAPGLTPATSTEINIEDDVRPSTPVLTATASTEDSVTVAWVAVGDDGDLGRAASQSLRYSLAPILTQADFDAATPVSVGAPEEPGTPESAVLTGLEPNTNYHVALEVVDNAGNGARSASLMIQTRDPGVSQLVFSQQPQGGVAGAVLPEVHVSLRNSSGEVVTTATSPVTLAVVGEPSFEPVQVAAVNGVAVFTGLVVEKAGTHRFTATVTGVPEAQSDVFTITPGAAARLGLIGLVGPVAAGVQGSVEVTAYDAFDNVVTGYTGQVRFTSTDAEAALPQDYTFTAGDQGTHVFNNGVTLRTSGAQTLTVTDLAAPQVSGELTVEVSTGAAASLALSELPVGGVEAGAAQNLTVTARDAFGNIVTGYAGTVRFESSDGQAVLPADYTFVPADAGLRGFSVTLVTVGSRSVTVRDVGNMALTATVSTEVRHGPVTQLRLALSTATASAGQSVGVTVSLRDAHDNLATGYRGTVHFSAPGDTQATLPANYTFGEEDGGQHLFNVSFATAGVRQLVVTDTLFAALTATGQVTVAPGGLAAFHVVAPTEATVAGEPQSFTVSAQDRFGNVLTDYSGTVVPSSSDAEAEPLSAYTYTEADDGVHTFVITFQTAGEQSVTFEDAQADVSGTAAFTVAAGAPTRLAFISAPETGSILQPLPVTRVALQDAFGNTADVTAPAVTLHLENAPGVTLGGTLTVSPVAGVAAFSDLTVNRAGDFVLTATSANPALTSAAALITLIDDVPPARPGMMLGLVNSSTVRVTWTATGDNGMDGTAARYELRYSNTPFDAQTFSNATEIPTGTPRSPWLPEELQVTPPVGQATTWYFGLRVFDAANNGSALTYAFIEVPGPCADLVCAPRAPECSEDGLSRVTYAEACVVTAGLAACEYTETPEVCPGQDGVCFEAACTTAPAPAAGELVISELMHRPDANTTEYLELTSTVDGPRDIANLRIRFDNGAGAVSDFSVLTPGDRPFIIPGRGTFVAASNADAANNGGVPAQYGYGGTLFTLGHSGHLFVEMGATVVDDVAYSAAFPQTVGRSMNLSSAVLGTRASQHAWYWCDSDASLPGGGRGTPGAANESCSVAITGPVDYCAIQYPKTFSAPISVGTSHSVFSQFYEPQVTNRNQNGNDGFPHLVAELGHGTDPSAPESWTWVATAPNPGYAPSGNNNDERVASLSVSVPGTYAYGFRYRFTQGPPEAQEWVYCDQDGVVAQGVTPNYGAVTVTPAAPPGANHVVISEVCGGNGTGSAATDEFIELYNPTNADLDIGNWRVQYKSATGSSYGAGYLIPAGTLIRAHGYFLLGGANYSGAVARDLSYGTTFDVSASTTAGGHIRIGPGLTTAVGDVAVDKVGWGTGNSPEGTAAPSHPSVGGSLERKALPTSTPATMAVGGSDALRGNGSDTDNNGADFVTRAVRQPQNSQSPTEQP